MSGNELDIQEMIEAAVLAAHIEFRMNPTRLRRINAYAPS